MIPVRFLILAVLVGFNPPHFSFSPFFPPLRDDVLSPGDSDDEIYADFGSLSTDLEDYSWPTEASTVLTSGFAEFRTTHFHAGIDISTWSRTGYKVLASRDGYVARANISPYGYGKILFLRHADGYYTAYAHLQRFNDVIDQYARSVQYANRRYSADLELPPHEIPVLKGDVIGYTGNTGIGSPHLHFEIRDERLNPVNPLLVPLFSKLIEDVTPPVFEEIAFTPLDYSSVVQGDHRPWIGRVKKISSHEYRLSTPVYLAGMVGVSVKAFDRANHSYYRNSIRSLEFYVDSLLLFNVRLDRFPAHESKQIALYYDWNLLQQRKGKFQKLYIEPGNRLPLYERLPESSGVFDSSFLPEGLHTFRVVASDHRGHASELRGTTIVSVPPTFDVSVIGQSLYLQPSDASAVRAVRVGRRRGSGWTMQTLSLAQLTSTENGYALHGKFAQVGVLRIELENHFGTSSAPQFIVPGKASDRAGKIRLEKEFFRDYLYLEMSAPSAFLEKPRVHVSGPSGLAEITATAKDPKKYFAIIPYALVHNDRLRVDVYGVFQNGMSSANLDIPIFPVTPGESRTLSANTDVILFFPHGAMYHPAYIRVEPTETGYSLLPHDIVLNKGVHVQYRVREPRDRLGLYMMEERGWELLARLDSAAAQTITGRLTRQLGSLALFYDNSSPTILNFTSRYRQGRFSFSFRLNDVGSGVDYNRTRITLDNALAIAEYDPYLHRVQFDEPRELSDGVHRLAIEVYDKMGNRAAREFSIRTSRR
ncbi:MAG: M23 family metallopeptidase [Ignavibacteriales bacterium]|nr:M23 family metallopeptidase [Ignavibacteriales bacterium]